jgi:hypothetical protein
MSDLGIILDQLIGDQPGPRKKPLQSHKVRDLGPSDLDKLNSAGRGDLGQEIASVTKIKQTHHALARLVAEGRRNEEISQIMGYSPSYISSLKNDPAFKNLVDYYSGMVDGVYENVQVSLHERLTSISMVAAEELLDRVTTEPEKFTNEELDKLIKTTADRTGFGPKATQVNVNVNLAQRLEAGRRRVESLAPPRHETPVLEGEISPPSLPKPSFNGDSNQ